MRHDSGLVSYTIYWSIKAFGRLYDSTEQHNLDI